MEHNEVDSKNVQTWSTERMAADALQVTAATVRGDAPALGRLAEAFREASNKLRPSVIVPLDPWIDPKVVYGAFLAMGELAELAARTVVSPDVMKDLVNSSEMRRILLWLAAQPGGFIRQARIPDVTGIHRANAHSTLKKLESKGLVERRVADARGRVITLELTNAGWAAVDLLRGWGLEESAQAITIAQLLRAHASAKRLAEALESGRGIKEVLGRHPKDASRLGKAIRLKIAKLEARPAVDFVMEFVEPRVMYELRQNASTNHDENLRHFCKAFGRHKHVFTAFRKRFEQDGNVRARFEELFCGDVVVHLHQDDQPLGHDPSTQSRPLRGSHDSQKGLLVHGGR